MNRGWLVLVAAILLALLLAPIVLLLFQRPAAAPAGQSPSPPVESSSAAPSEADELGIDFADAAAPEDAAWYRIGGDPRQFPPHLTVGTMTEGTTFDVEMRFDAQADPDSPVPLRPVLGVGDGVVVIVDDDGTRSAVRAVVAATGRVHDLAAMDDVIVAGTLDTDGRIAYFVTADRVSGDLSGAWRLDVDGRAAAEPIRALVAEAPPIRLAAIVKFRTDLMLSPDGGTLVLFRCVELDCFLRAVRTDTGELIGEAAIPRGGGTPFAVTDRLALLRPEAPDGPHHVGEVVDLATGAIEPMPFVGWPSVTEAMVGSPDGPLMALQTAGFTAPPEGIGQPGGVQPVVTVFTVPDLQVAGEVTPPLSSLQLLPLDEYSVGVDLPSGWLLISGSMPGEVRMSAYALSLADGGLVRLPAVGEFFVQG